MNLGKFYININIIKYNKSVKKTLLILSILIFFIHQPTYAQFLPFGSAQWQQQQNQRYLQDLTTRTLTNTSLIIHDKNKEENAESPLQIPTLTTTLSITPTNTPKPTYTPTPTVTLTPTITLSPTLTLIPLNLFIDNQKSFLESIIEWIRSLFY